MKHLSTVDFLRDLARRTDADYDRGRLADMADVIEGMDEASRASLEPKPDADRVADRLPRSGTEASMQAAAQGEGSYLPARRAPDAPAPLHVAEPANTGMEPR